MTPPAAPRHLWVLRHAEAAPEPPGGGADRDRPLTERGRRDAAALGALLAAGPPVLGMDAAPVPQLALCSSALRTSQTAQALVDASDGALLVDTYRSLYGAGTDLVLQYLREVDEQVESLLVVGHNPTMAELVGELAAAPAPGGGDAPGPGAHLAHGFPTCALAVLALDVASWEDVTEGSGRLVGLFRPPYGG